MSYFIYSYIDLISSLLDLKLVDPGSTLIHVDARYNPMRQVSYPSAIYFDTHLQVGQELFCSNQVRKHDEW